MRYVIIGDGVAGTTAAMSIRKGDPSGEITMLTSEAYPFYSRIRLIELLSGGLEKEKLLLKKAEWYTDNNIELFTSTRAIDVDVIKKEVETVSSGKIGYDKLLLATGSHSFLPPIQGVDKRGVYALRTIADAIKITEAAKERKRVVIIGGGVLGLEAGHSLITAGCEVTVVEFFERLLPRQMDGEGAGILQAQLEGIGFRFYLGVKSKEITGEDRANSLLLEGGTEIDCDMIVISAGVRPNLALPKKLGLKAGRGLPVNNRMETEIPDIYAAGDLVEHKGVYYGLWQPADQQGAVAGANMAGGDAQYGGSTISSMLKVAGVKLVSVGEIDAEGKYESIVMKDEKEFLFSKLVINDNRIIGAILYGDIKPKAKIVKAIESGRDVSAILGELKEWDFKSL